MAKANTSKIIKLRPMAQVHLDELAALWPTDPRIPTAASRRAWSLARNLLPGRVNAWWYYRKRVAKRLRMKIPNEEYELPVGQPPVVEDNVKEEEVDERFSSMQGDDGVRVKCEPKVDRLGSEESLDIPLMVICARKRDLATKVDAHHIALDSLLEYASSDTAYSPPPCSDSARTVKKRAYTEGKHIPEDSSAYPVANSTKTIEGHPKKNSMAETCSDRPSTLPLPSTGALLCSTPSTSWDTDLDSSRTCDQGLPALNLPPFTCPLCRTVDGDHSSAVNSVSSDKNDALSLATNCKNRDSSMIEIATIDGSLLPEQSVQRQGIRHATEVDALATIPFLPHPHNHCFLPLLVRPNYLNLDDRYYTFDGMLLNDPGSAVSVLNDDKTMSPPDGDLSLGSVLQPFTFYELKGEPFGFLPST